MRRRTPRRSSLASPTGRIDHLRGAAPRPLWGVGQHLFFLHDGRARDLQDAIRAHYSPPAAAHGRDPAYPASEANQVIVDYFRLTGSEQQDVLDFLRSL